MVDRIVIRPQPGCQEQALASRADITIVGGAAGVGKTWQTMVNPLRGVGYPGFTGAIFRRTTRQLTGAGSIWEEALPIYRAMGGRENLTSLSVRWPKTNALIQFAHLEYDKNKLDYQSKALAFIGFEELTHFLESQFWYLWSRNRPAAGCRVKPWMVGTCNPDPDSFVRDLVDWWIDDDGFPIWGRSGILRWFVRVGNDIVWVDGPDYVDSDGERSASSLTFIPGRLDENKVLMKLDPGYRRRLKNLPYIEQQRLLYGNWNVRADASMFSGPDSDPTYINPDELPAGLRWVRAWDRGSRKRKPGVDPDMTCGALVAVQNPGDPERERVFVSDIRSLQGSPKEVVDLIAQTAEMDGPNIPIYLEEERGAAGKEATYLYKSTHLRGYNVVGSYVTGDKETRAKGWANVKLGGRLVLVRGSWNAALVDSMANFPGGKRDFIDAVSLGYHGSREIAGQNQTRGGVVERRSRAQELKQWM